MGGRTDERFMRLAIEKAKQGVENGQAPFGACVVKNGKVISCAHNMVWKNTDILLTLRFMQLEKRARN